MDERSRNFHPWAAKEGRPLDDWGVVKTHKETTMEEDQIKTMAMLKERFGIVGPFVRVMQLAAVLGVDSSSIYRAMKEGRFMMPYQMIMASPVVKLDDFVAWYLKSNQPYGPVPKVVPAVQAVTVKERVISPSLSERLAHEANTVYGRDLVAAMCEKLGMQHKTGKVASRLR
jgi:predicted DNA-binding transcriptional regulator AlpA